MTSIKNWKKIENGYWEHESGRYYISFYHAGEWYAELQDEEQNSIGIVSYTKYKADGLKNCSKVMRFLSQKQDIDEFIRNPKRSTYEWIYFFEELEEAKHYK